MKWFLFFLFVFPVSFAWFDAEIGQWTLREIYGCFFNYLICLTSYIFVFFLHSIFISLCASTKMCVFGTRNKFAIAHVITGYIFFHNIQKKFPVLCFEKFLVIFFVNQSTSIFQQNIAIYIIDDYTHLRRKKIFIRSVGVPVSFLRMAITILDFGSV